MGLLNGGQTVEREAEPKLGLTRETVGLDVALARVDHDLAALERLRDPVLDEHAHARERGDLTLVWARQVAGEQEWGGRVSTAVSDHERQVVAALGADPADHLGGRIGEHNADVAVSGHLRNLYSP